MFTISLEPEEIVTFSLSAGMGDATPGPVEMEEEFDAVDGEIGEGLDEEEED